MSEDNVAAPTAAVDPAASTINKVLNIKLPAPLEKRKEIAAQLGFKEIAEIRPALKSADVTVVANAKKYAELVKAAKEPIDISITFPAANSLTVEQVQDLLASGAEKYAYNAVLAARRGGTELPLTQTFSYYDYLEEGEEGTDLDEQKDTITAILDAFCKFKGFNETTATIVTAGVIGTKPQMIKFRKFFAPMERAMQAFVEYASEQSDVDFELVGNWLKRQTKRLNSAKATPEIDESAITI